MMNAQLKMQRVLTLLFILFGGMLAQAEHVPLSQLLTDGGTVESGDKVFSGFSYAKNSKMPDADAVNVLPITDRDGNHGLRIQGGFAESPRPGSANATLGFTVTTSDPNFQISGARLASNTAAIFGADVMTTATFSNGANLVAFDNTTGTDLLDTTSFASSTRSLDVSVKIDIETLENLSAGTVSFVDLTFEQVVIPEPNCWVMLIGTFAALMCFRRSRLRLG